MKGIPISKLEPGDAFTLQHPSPRYSYILLKFLSRESVLVLSVLTGKSVVASRGLTVYPAPPIIEKVKLHENQTQDLPGR